MSSKLAGVRPDLTLAQIVALFGGGLPVVLTLLAAFGVFDPTAVQREALSDATQWLGTMSVALFGADAAIRIGRNLKDGKVEAAAMTPALTPATVTRELLPLGEPVGAFVQGNMGTFEHEDQAAAYHAEGLPSDEEEFGRSGDAGPDGEQPLT